MRIIETELNLDYLIAKQNRPIDYVDVFQLKTDLLNNAPAPKDCMIAFFKSFSPFMMRIILSREAIGRTVGLKTATKIPAAEREKQLNTFQGNIGDSIAIFDVLDKSENELLTGQTDKHLDFRLSFISYKEGSEVVVELATTVNMHNVFGRIYCCMVRPFHRYFMKRILRNMEQVLLLLENETTL